MSPDQASGTGVEPGAALLLQRYRDLLLRANQTTNLTAVTDPDEIDRRLVGDSLRLLPAIDTWVAANRGGGQPVRLVDIGSGGGLPGLPIAIARPGIEVTLVDATGKKVQFLQSAIEALGLPNVTAVHGRAEALGHDPAWREGWDLATARAVSSVAALAELLLPLLRVGGRAFLPKGADITDELAQGERAAGELGGSIRSADLLPEDPSGIVTRLVVLDKLAPTPIRYPRRAGIPAREPLGRTSGS